MPIEYSILSIKLLLDSLGVRTVYPFLISLV